MLDHMQTARRYLWAFVEIGFVALLAILLVFLVLGDGSGVFVQGVADNVVKFANAVPPGALVGFAMIGALLYWISCRTAA